MEKRFEDIMIIPNVRDATEDGCVAQASYYEYDKEVSVPGTISWNIIGEDLYDVVFKMDVIE